MKYFLCSLFIVFFVGASSYEDWGFYAHKRINRLAVFTLPNKMLYLFKTNIDFIAEHAVDPDKRRYAVRLEAPRHYLDLDKYQGKCLPRDIDQAFAQYSEILCINGIDTVPLTIQENEICDSNHNLTVLFQNQKYQVDKKTFISQFRNEILPQYYDPKFVVSPTCLDFIEEIKAFKSEKIVLKEHLSEHGLVPFIVEQNYKKLVTAFKNKDVDRIMNIAADLGHYIGDLHVPLHAHSNYNGQATDQVGIHAFWESRIPELFAEDQYDFWVGKAKYIDNVRDVAWTVIYESHQLADSVLIIEKKLSQTYPSNQQFCFDERLNKVVWTHCREYAATYQNLLNGMVERRMQEAIICTGSFWYSAWVDAGQPDLDPLAQKLAVSEDDSVNVKYQKAIDSGFKGHGRDHE